MAKKDNAEKAGKGYIITGIALAIIMILNMSLMYYNYSNVSNTSTQTSNEMNLLNSSNGQLESIHQQIIEIFADIGKMPAHAGQVNSLFPQIEAKLDQYDATSTNFYARRRLQHAKSYIVAYKNKITPYVNQLNQIYLQQQAVASSEEADALEEQFESVKSEFRTVYDEEVAPLQTAWQQLLIAAVNINSRMAADRSDQLNTNMFFLITILAVIFVIGEIAIFVTAKISKRAQEEISRKTAQFAEASNRLMRSREKIEDIAVSNILTGLKNRYALEQDIGERLATEQFNIAVFDLDNFRSINDTYGYDFGDEYLAQIAERLKTEFEQFADIYNITGNEFCFVFNRTVSDTQVARIIDNIVQVMAAPYTIMNLTVQLTVSGSTYHYLAGDCLNVNSLLVKMDNVMRNAKRAGGGQIHQVMNI